MLEFKDTPFASLGMPQGNETFCLTRFSSYHLFFMVIFEFKK